MIQRIGVSVITRDDRSRFTHSSRSIGDVLPLHACIREFLISAIDDNLAKELGLPPVAGAIEVLPAHDTSGASARLRNCLMGGTAFHNTNLGPEERSIVESYFRNPAGGIEALAATTTLAAGINTPASTVILAENEFIGEDGRPFTVAEYKNMRVRWVSSSARSPVKLHSNR